MSDDNKIRDAADAVKGVVEAVPIYQDAVQPAAKEVGIALQTVAKSIHVALAPIKGLVWGYERIVAYLDAKLSERLKDVPPERLITPNPIVAVPVMQSLLYTAQEEDLREMFGNLLATSMDKEVAKNAHPSFVELIKQLSPDEARLVRYLSTQNKFVKREYTPPGFAKVAIVVHFDSDTREPWNVSYGDIAERAGILYKDLFESYLDNLTRLGLLEINHRNAYPDINEDALYAAIKRQLRNDESLMKMRYGGGAHADFKEEFVSFTSFGWLFANACMQPDGTVTRSNESQSIGQEPEDSSQK
jgi:hypothetical protein